MFQIKMVEADILDGWYGDDDAREKFSGLGALKIYHDPNDDDNFTWMKLKVRYMENIEEIGIQPPIWSCWQDIEVE